MDYIQITDEQHREMLASLGVGHVDDLYSNLPEAIRLADPLQLPPARSELELQRELTSRGASNRPAAQRASFLGCGAYDHFIPTVVDTLAGQGQFVTAYTPYQAEASQGSLQAFFEFQTQIARLTGLDAANASLYEGATASSEAVMLAVNTTGKRRVLVASTLHPDYRAVVRTYLADLPAQYVELPASEGRIDATTLKQHVDNDTACVIIQSPNVFGLLENWSTLFDVTHEQANTLAIAIFNPIASGLLKRPGDCGADIAVGEGQPLGIPLQFGGPWLGLFAVRRSECPNNSLGFGS